MKTSRAAALAVVLTIAIAGCGGSSNKQLSYSGFISKMNDLCSKGEAEFAKVQSPKDAEKLVDKYLKKFKDTKPPDQLQAPYDEFISITERQVDALKKQDTSEFNRLNTDSNKAAAKMGTRQCINE